MREDLKSWLAGDGSPADHYQLMGKPRFSRDREGLVAAGRAGYAELQGYQNADQTLRRRARDLQLQFASAVQVFSSEETWRVYDEQLQRATAASGPLANAAAAAPAVEATTSPSPAPLPPPTSIPTPVPVSEPLPADAPRKSEVSAPRMRVASWLRAQLPAYDPRGIRLMLFLTAVTANGILALGGLTIYLVRVFSRAGG